MAHWDKVYIVDDDVDPTDCDQVLEAVFTQVDPACDYNITDNDSPKAMIAGAYLDDIDLERNALELSCLTTKHIVDATTKGNSKIRRTSFETVFPEHMQKWVIDNWERWGFEEKAKWNKPYIDQKP
jgi:3-polyprenyl-4-hydroxybenzoate decarboxylase